MALVVRLQRGLLDIAREESGALTDAEGFESAVMLSLFSDSRVGDDEAQGDDPRGWWGDTWSEVAGDQLGSRLWAVLRGGSPEELAAARTAAEEALQWMVADGAASAVSCEVSLAGDRAVLQVEISKPLGLNRWVRAWEVVSHGV